MDALAASALRLEDMAARIHPRNPQGPADRAIFPRRLVSGRLPRLRGRAAAARPGRRSRPAGHDSNRASATTGDAGPASHSLHRLLCRSSKRRRSGVEQRHGLAAEGAGRASGLESEAALNDRPAEIRDAGGSVARPIQPPGLAFTGVQARGRGQVPRPGGAELQAQALSRKSGALPRDQTTTGHRAGPDDGVGPVVEWPARDSRHSRASPEHHD